MARDNTISHLNTMNTKSDPTHNTAENHPQDETGQFFSDMIVGSNPRMREILHIIHRLSPTDFNVLIIGESGTGKELVARAIHQNSPRKQEKLVCIDCTTISHTLAESELFGHVKGAFTGAVSNKKGLFESAHKGTIFLDEIGELDYDLQGKLLRVIETNEFRPVGANRMLKSDVRIISATNRTLEHMIKSQKFREDLYYRISPITISLPPLRKRKEDIPLLAQKFLEKNARRIQKDVNNITNKCMSKLLAYPYPGNVRELENIIQESLVNCTSNELREEDLPPRVRIYEEDLKSFQSLRPNMDNVELKKGFKALRQEFLARFEKELLALYLAQAEGNITQAAILAGIDRVTFHRILKRHRKQS